MDQAPTSGSSYCSLIRALAVAPDFAVLTRPVVMVACETPSDVNTAELTDWKSFGGSTTWARIADQRPLCHAARNLLSVARGVGELPPHPASTTARISAATTSVPSRTLLRESARRPGTGSRIEARQDERSIVGSDDLVTTRGCLPSCRAAAPPGRRGQERRAPRRQRRSAGGDHDRSARAATATTTASSCTGT